MKSMERLRIFNYIVIIQILFSGLLIQSSVAKRNAGEFIVQTCSLPCRVISEILLFWTFPFDNET
jgi:hypothetical protein